MEFQKYQELGGKLSEELFASLIPYTETFINSYIGAIVAYWLFDEVIEKLKETGDLDKLIAVQLDFFESAGGYGVFNGENEFKLSSVSTSGFSYQIGKGSQEENIRFFKGVPLSPVVDMELTNTLRKCGFLYRGL